MTTIKMFQTAVLVLLVSVLVGCSDQFISSSGQGENSSESTKSEIKNKVPVYNSTIILKPNRSYTFNRTNTPFTVFNSVSVEGAVNVDLDNQVCNYISIFGGMTKLECNSIGLNESSITIKNNSSKLLKLNVALSGYRVKQKTEEE